MLIKIIILILSKEYSVKYNINHIFSEICFLFFKEKFSFIAKRKTWFKLTIAKEKKRGSSQKQSIDGWKKISKKREAMLEDEK